MSDLAEFLLSRVAEDEATARAVDEFNFDDGAITICDAPWAVERAFAERFTVRRVLAECEAKRRIVTAYRSAKIDADYWSQRAPGSVTAEQAVARLSAWTFALTPLALVYADHPDYRDEW